MAPKQREEERPGTPIHELDDPTEAIELERSFDPGASEPIDELPLDPSSLAVEEEIELDTTEPDGTDLGVLPRLDVLIRPTDDLEDFSTQEEIPMLPWRLEAELLECGHTLPAVLDPTAATTTWEKPGGGEPQRLTIKLRMVVAAVDITVVEADRERLRVGRDLLAGRVVILVE